MRNNRIYGRLATEDIEAIATPAGEDPVAAEPIEAGADSLEADLIEVNDDVVEVQAGEETIDQAAEVVEEMEVAVESLAIIAQNGGLDKGGAAMLNLMQASWNRRLGLPVTHSTMSTESFGGSNSRAGQTTLALESIKDKAKSIWAAIVEMFKKALSAIANVWNRIFDGATKLRARSANLYKAARSVGSATAKEQTFENSTLANNLHMNGAVDAKAAATAVLGEANELAGLTARSIKFAEDTISALTAGPQQEAHSFETIIKGAKGLAAGPGFTKVADPASVGIGQPEHTELFKGKALPGNKAIIAIVPASTDINEEATGYGLKNAGIKVGTFDASKKADEKAALKVLSPQDIATIAKQMSDTADKLLSYKAEQKKAEAVAKQMIAACEKIANETMNADIKRDFTDKDGKVPVGGKAIAGVLGWANGKVGQAVAKTSLSMVVNTAPQVAGYVLNAGSAVLQYGEQSMKQYGKAAAAPAKDATPEAAAA